MNIISWLIELSPWFIPLLILIVLGMGFYKRVKVYEVFIAGVIEGLQTTLKLAPYLIAIFAAISLFRNSGALNFLLYLFNPLIRGSNLHPDLLTLALLKPLSGSAALGTTAELLKQHGPDSALGITASIIQGSCETTFYVVSLYLGAVGLKDSRHLLAIGLSSEAVVFILAVILGSIIVP